MGLGLVVARRETVSPPPPSEARVARRKRARSSSSSGREISTCLGGRIRGTTRKSKGNESKRAKERTNCVLNIAKNRKNNFKDKKSRKKK